MPEQRTIAVCTGCGETKPIVSRGECAACNRRRRRAEGLDPDTRSGSEQKRRASAAYDKRMKDAGYARRLVDGRRQWVKIK